MSLAAAASTWSSLLEFWLGLREQYQIPELLEYRPAVVFECLLDFRDVRAELVDSQEQLYSAWLPDGDSAVDWSKKAYASLSPEMLESQPRPGIRLPQESARLDSGRLDKIESDLIDYLTRSEKRKVLFNPNFRLYSRMNESPRDFLNRVREESSPSLQSDLKELTHSLQLQLERHRESSLPKGLSDDRVQQLGSTRRRMIAKVENRLNEAIWASHLPASGELFHVETSLDRPSEELSSLEGKLRELERETFEKLRQLIASYNILVQDCCDYFVGLHPNNIRIIRRGLLWIPALS